MKTCSKCNQTKESNLFNKHYRTRDGLDSSCKACKKISSQTAGAKRKARVREKRSYDLHKNKWKAREAARAAYSAQSFRCSVLNCGESSGIELHHIDYADPLAVVPLCKDCHVRNHSLR